MKRFLVQVLFLCFLLPGALWGADSTTFNPGSVDAKSISGVPIGGVVAWRSPKVPDGWLECNGQSTAAYPELAALVGSKVPDLRGEFIRGWSNGKAGVDSGRALGSWQEDMFKSHTHGIQNRLEHRPIDHDKDYHEIDRGVTTSLGTPSGATGGEETRPRNVALMYIIRAR